MTFHSKVQYKRLKQVQQIIPSEANQTQIKQKYGIKSHTISQVNPSPKKSDHNTIQTPTNNNNKILSQPTRWGRLQGSHDK